MSTSLSKKIALEFACCPYDEDNPKIPVLLEIQLRADYNFYGYDSE